MPHTLYQHHHQHQPHQLQSIVKRLGLMVLMAIMSFSAFALDLQSAKKQGLVGEMTSGYLGAVVKNADTAKLVKQVNGKRKQLYMNLAKKNKISVKQVAALAGEKAIKKTAKGNYVQNAQGKWVKK